jgi:hypothetical protein
LFLAQAFSLLKKDRETLQFATESEQLLGSLGKNQYEWIAALLRARASRNSHDEATAKQEAARASTIFASLEQRWGADNFNSYRNRQDVRFYQQQLNQFLTQSP